MSGFVSNVRRICFTGGCQREVNLTHTELLSAHSFALNDHHVPAHAMSKIETESRLIADGLRFALELFQVCSAAALLVVFVFPTLVATFARFQNRSLREVSAAAKTSRKDAANCK
jgi:hypothetical protein